MTGEQLLNEVHDLIRARVGLLPPDDPIRPALLALVPALGNALGRPRLEAVGRES